MNAIFQKIKKKTMVKDTSGATLNINILKKNLRFLFYEIVRYI